VKMFFFYSISSTRSFEHLLAVLIPFDDRVLQVHCLEGEAQQAAL